jgi:hypothetical protein
VENDEARMTKDEGMTANEELMLMLVLVLIIVIESEVRGRCLELGTARRYLAD